MQANLAALHRMRNQFMSVVQLHQEASLSITPRADARAKAALVVVGYNAEGDGLGSHAHYLMGHLARVTGAGNVALLETDGDPETQPDLDAKKVLVVVEPYRIHTREPRPRGLREYRVNLCLFESDRLPTAWAGELNTHSSEVWTTSSWLAQSFRASGVYVPIKVLPIGTEAPRLEPAWHVSEHRSVCSCLGGWFSFVAFRVGVHSPWDDDGTGPSFRFWCSRTCSLARASSKR